MNKTHTLDQLILLAYNEKGTEPPDELLDALIHDEELSEDYVTIQRLKTFLDKAFVEPKENTICNIMNYSKALQVIPVQSAPETGFLIRN
jgi:hypothetical protein